MSSSVVHVGDCVEVLREMEKNSVDSVVTDPPYHLTSTVKRYGKEDSAPAKTKQTGVYARSSVGFLGQKWDGGDVAFRPETWEEVLRVLKPGGHLAAFSGTRTYHRMACAIEDAGFDVRDQAAWCYSTGFPKSHDVSKAIDKKFGVERDEGVEVAGRSGKHAGIDNCYGYRSTYQKTEPKSDDAVKWEGWGTALKPAWEPICLARKPLNGTVVENVLTYDTGALNIDGCRFGESGGTRGCNYEKTGLFGMGEKAEIEDLAKGRFPANLLHDGDQFGEAGRYFYSAKVNRADRGEGNFHPTVKPTDLMDWLTRLVTPPGGTVLDPFTGSGSTGRGAMRNGFDFVGVEMSEEYAEVARRRISETFDQVEETKPRSVMEDLF